MFVMFDKGQCHVCGDHGKEIEKNIFKCTTCDTLFNSFGVSPYTELNDDKFSKVIR
tara:strand:+ start:1705 stop:1872 length:168 start_codon:yes stop_codon:yes gene_type:complete